MNSKRSQCIGTLVLIVSLLFPCLARVFEHTYKFSDYSITPKNEYHVLQFQNTKLKGKIGEPALPYFTATLLLPPGEAAENVEFIGLEEIDLPNKLKIHPRQYPNHFCAKTRIAFQHNRDVYSGKAPYNPVRHGSLNTKYMNGYALATFSFTPVTYNPVSGKVSYFRKVKLQIATKKSDLAEKTLDFLHPSMDIQNRVKSIVDNPQVFKQYRLPAPQRADYDMLIITPEEFKTDFKTLSDMHEKFKIKCTIKTTEEIALQSGNDDADKIRNCIIKEYKDNKIKFVLLGGDAEKVAYRKLYGEVKSSSVYKDNMPADLYYSGLDGNWNKNGNSTYGEKDDEPDDLPDIAVGRLPISTKTDLDNIFNKITSYMTKPIFEQCAQPLMVGEHLYNNPVTWGADYMELLIGDHDENGFKTIGIPKATNDIRKLYDKTGSTWNKSKLLDEISKGPSFIHHCGHANYNTVMRFYTNDIKDNNFSKLDGKQHNFTLVMTHGCICGAFERNDCIGETMVKIKTFASAFIGNSREGWFIEGTTDGAAEHLHREFVSALYGKKTDRLGEAFLISKVKSKNFLDLPDEYEPGAMRWNFYCMNVLGDPAMIVRITKDPTAIDNPNNFAYSANTAPLKVQVLNNKVTISYVSAGNGPVELAIFSLNGKLIKTITKAKPSKGWQSAQWDISNSASGFYTIQRRYNNTIQAKNVCIIR